MLLYILGFCEIHHESWRIHGRKDVAQPCRAPTVAACQALHAPLLDPAARESPLWLC